MDMVKRFFRDTKDAAFVLGIIGSIVGAAMAYSKSEERNHETQKNVGILQTDTKEMKEDLIEQTGINIAQTVMIERTVKILDKIEDNVNWNKNAN